MIRCPAMRVLVLVIVYVAVDADKTEMVFMEGTQESSSFAASLMTYDRLLFPSNDFPKMSARSV